MGKFNEYTQKATPEDADTLMIYDAAAKANKLSPFSGIWNWIVGKLTNAVISNLQTNNKSVVGALNELNSNGFFIKHVNESDADNITKPGLYRCSNLIGVAGINFGYMFVFSLYNDERYVLQVLHDANSSDLRRRICISSKWTDWIKM